MSKKRTELGDDETLDQGALKMTREQPPSVFLSQLRSGGDLRNVDSRDDDNEILDIENKEFTLVHYEGFDFDFDRPINFKGCVFDNAHFENTKGYFAFLNCSFRECFFTNATLKNCTFSKCHFLGDTNFERTNLKNAKFINCTLDNVVFKDANLQKAEFPQCTLRATTFENADLSDSRFYDKTWFKNVDFNNGNLTNVTFSGSLIFDEVYFEKAHVNGIKFLPNFQYFNLNSLFQSGLDFSNTTGIVCENCALELTTLQLTRAQFIDCEFTNNMMGNCTFNSVLFIRCVFNNMTIFETNVYNDNTGFSNCSFLGTNLADCDLRNIDFRDLEPHNFDNQTDFRNALLPPNLLTFLRNLPPDNRPIGLPVIGEQPVVGRAFEIHDDFENLNLNGIAGFLRNYIQQHPNINPNTLAPQNEEIPSNHFVLPILLPLVYFIYNSHMYDKNFALEKLNDLQAISNKIRTAESYQKLVDIIADCINFVVRQDNDFIEQYINMLTQDCVHAYSGQGHESCAKGMVERYITMLRETAQARLIDPNLPSDQRLLFEGVFLHLFKKIDDIAVQWKNEFIENEDKRQELLKTLTKEERKQQFFDYIAKNYEPYIDDAFRQKIWNYVNRMDYVLEDLILGGSRKKRLHYKKTKKATKKGKKKRTYKKYRTQRNKYRKRTNLSKRK